MKTNSPYRSAFTLVEIMIVVAIIGLLASIAIPSFVRARTTAQMTACQRNLHAIFGAKQTWVTEGRRPGTSVPTEQDLFGTGKFIPKTPKACRYTREPLP
jgi:prepilin-type N-terminal cleavage/methylation domain-containing protein